ncbi:hypothetical protein N780_02855 [Pontibacillus chungwhensis BH030062]|uniref:SPOR domain-containing protein n=1 Tax=Pontibacillus chungwhensis BH030062 TaxID=1385513 RepID=A0A0A2UW53_9BACI|nr:SPOR domain-containing protein [Pontibacillus chungwhensis]KGP90968.1 hypothetical protein N780_02855 [Pontibacillus chungwhensis BH030062]
MDKHNKISVRINGEDTYLDRDKDVKEKNVTDELVVAKEEQASAIEEWMEEQEKKKQTKEEVKKEKLPVFERNYSPKKRSFSLPSEMKQLLIAAASAILVGTLIGFIMIRIFGGIEGSANGGAQPAMPALQSGTAQDQGGVSGNGNAQALSFPGVSAYVVQAGIFSTEEKAKTWASNLSEKGLEGYIWPRDGQFYLFAGVASSKENGEKIATYLKDQGFETFVKEWHVGSGEKKVAKAEGTWIQSGVEAWKNVLPATTSLIETGSGTASELAAKVDAWKKAIPNEASEKTAPIQESFNQFSQAAQAFEQNKSTTSLWDMQTSMLSVWHDYEQYLK